MNFKTQLLFLFFLFTLGCSVLGDQTLIVTDGSSSENNNPVPVTIKIVSAAGGAGTEITTVDLIDNNSVTLFAASFDSNGNYMADVSVNWSNLNSLGSFSATSGISTIFTPNAGAGTEIITATHSTLGSDSTSNLDINFTVSNLAGLEAWFKADLGVSYDGSNVVTSWADQSLNANHATQPGAIGLKPLYTAAAINGKPALSFDGADDFLTTNTSIVSGNMARTIFIVARNITNTGVYNALFELTNSVAGAGTNYGITTEVAVRVSGNRVFNEGIAPGETKVLTVTTPSNSNTNSIETYLDGVLSTQSAVSVQAINTLANPALIGQAAFASSNCHCDIAEIIVYSSLLLPIDQQSIENYLANKYGL